MIPTLAQIEESYIRSVLAMFDGNVREAAVALGITELATRNKIIKYGIRPCEPKAKERALA